MASRINVVARNLTVNVNGHGHTPSSIANRIGSSASTVSHNQTSNYLALENSTRSNAAASVVSASTARHQPTYSGYSTYSTRTGASRQVPERVEIKPRDLTDYYPDFVPGSSVAPDSSISCRGSQVSSASRYAPSPSQAGGQMQLYTPTGAGAASAVGSVHTVRTGHTARTGTRTARSSRRASRASSRAGGSQVSTTSRASRASRSSRLSRAATNVMALMRMGTVPEAEAEDSDEEYTLVKGFGHMDIRERCWDGDRGWERKEVFKS